ncbi:hypothetical protein EZ313_22140 [Ramlibacter henchirensis]|uniref:Uncharacterized protein n=1 Tax=Ramlibacter henchirensis TaxID=204072 RepID=A0A4Z0BIY4_9BURK|nr:hypothetical protein [Ramlibacter henchirensis]TFY99266.1 hypothetical protein EZ313_22140 [Ramlibacter henchirensis]
MVDTEGENMSRLLIAVAVVALVGCSDPKHTALPTEIEKYETIKPQVEKLTPEERELFAKYAMRKAMKGTLLGGMAGATDATTIGEAIENQRTFMAEAARREAEAAALKEKAKAQREAGLKAMRDIVTVALVSKRLDVQRGYSGIEMDRKFVMSVAYKNSGTKDIAGVKGTLIVQDLFGDTLSEFLISNDETIKVGDTVTWTGSRSTRFSFGNNKDEKLAELSDDKFKVVWEPEMVVFTDGTKLTAPK